MNWNVAKYLFPPCLPVPWSQVTKAVLKNWREASASTCEKIIQGAQHMISVKQLRFSSCPRAKVSHQGPQCTALEHRLGYNVQSCPCCVFCVCAWSIISLGTSWIMMFHSRYIFLYIGMWVEYNPSSCFLSTVWRWENITVFNAACGMHALSITYIGTYVNVKSV